jgi:ankyrin repeat protein
MKLGEIKYDCEGDEHIISVWTSDDLDAQKHGVCTEHPSGNIVCYENHPDLETELTMEDLGVPLTGCPKFIQEADETPWFAKEFIINAGDRGDIEEVKALFFLYGKTIPESGVATCFSRAATNGHLNILEFVLKETAPAPGSLPIVLPLSLDNPVINGHTEVVAFLLANGAKETLSYTDHRAIEYAAYYDRQKILKMLLASGESPDANDGIAIRRASTAGNLEIVKILIQAGADVNAGARLYPSALENATSNGYFDIVKILVNNGAGITRSELDCARYNGYLDIQQFLFWNYTHPHAKNRKRR